MHCFHSQVPPIQFSPRELLPYCQLVCQHFMLWQLNRSRNVIHTHNPCQPVLCHNYLHCKAHPILIQKTAPILSASLPTLHALGTDPPTMSASHTIHVNPCYAMTICIGRQHLAEPAMPCSKLSIAQALCCCPTSAAAFLPASLPGEGLGVCGQTSGVPAIVTGELSLQV
jgi:hypothetical protein